MCNNCQDKGCVDCTERRFDKEPHIYQIIIEGHDEDEVRELFEEIQNKYDFYDNCVMQTTNPTDTIIDKDRYEETGRLKIDKELVKKFGE